MGDVACGLLRGFAAEGEVNERTCGVVSSRSKLAFIVRHLCSYVAHQVPRQTERVMSDEIRSP